MLRCDGRSQASRLEKNASLGISRFGPPSRHARRGSQSAFIDLVALPQFWIVAIPARRRFGSRGDPREFLSYLWRFCSGGDRRSV